MKIKYDFSELTNFIQELADPYSLESAIMAATKELAQELHDALITRTPIKTGNLRAAWSRDDNLQFNVKEVNGGYEVTLTNKAENNGHMYGTDVNDGHRSFNQYGGPYGFVPGKFFVEKSIVSTAPKCERVIYNELEKWMEGRY